MSTLWRHPGGKTLLGLVLCFLVNGGHAEETASSFDGVAIKPTPDLFSYQITLTTDSDEELKKAMAADPTLKMPVDSLTNEIVQWKIVHSGKINHLELTAKNGLQGEVWVVGKTEVVRQPGTTLFYFNRPSPPPPPDPYHLDFGKDGFPFALWIKASLFDGKVPYQGKKRAALYFADKAGGVDRF